MLNKFYLENDQEIEINTGLYTVKTRKSYTGKEAYTVIITKPDVELQKYHDTPNRILVEAKEVE